jgi:hypothetical protein
MAFQVSPGINISEQDLTTVVPNVATAIGAYAGGFQWGPVDERTTVTTENELVDIFGKPNAATYKHFWTCANYLAYSNNLIVARCVETAATNATIGDNAPAAAGADVYNATHYDSITPANDVLFIAKYPGSLGNSLKVVAIDSNAWADATVNADFIANFDGAPGTSADVLAANGGSGTYDDEMHILVIDEDGLWTGTPGYVLEKHAYVSKASDAKRHDGSSNYVKDVLRNESKYVWLGDVTQLTTLSVAAGREAGQPKVGAAFQTFDSVTPAEGVLGGSMGWGDDGNSSATEAVTYATRTVAGKGYNLFATSDVVDVNLILGGETDAATNSSLAGMVGQGATERNDAMVFLSPGYAAAVTTKTNAAVIADKNISSNYCVFDGAWKYQYDRYRDIFMWVPMNGDTAGLCARTEYTNDAWWSPAGMTRGQIKNIVKLSWEPTKADRDELYKKSINPLINITGAGAVLWGDKTCQITPTAFDRINVRRLFIVLEKAISIAAKSMLFEFNDVFTRSSFVNMVTPFLREVQGRRGITDFKVVCDGSNNTGQIIDTNQFVGDIYIKPARSINYIQLNFIAARTDVSFSEIGG